MIKADPLTLINTFMLLVTSIITAWSALAARRDAKQRMAETKVLAEKVEQVHLATNSLQDKMIAAKDAEVLATAAAQHAIGLAAGIVEGKADQKIADQKIADQKK